MSNLLRNLQCCFDIAVSLPLPFIFFKVKNEEWNLLLYSLEIQSGKCPIFITYFLSF